MKRFFKILSLSGFVGIIFLTCETTDLDLRVNPNTLSPEQADVNALLNNIQLEFIDMIDGTGSGFARVGAELARIDYMFGRNYTNNYGPSTFDGNWRRAYAEMMTDIRIMLPLAEEGGLTTHIGIAKTLEAFTLVTLVDFFGDVPYSEALQGSGNFNPNVDAGADVYAAAVGLLDEAIAAFNETPASGPQNDFYYGGNRTKWIKAANTIKLKIYLQSRLVDNSAIANFNSIISSGNYINSSADDFQFNGWGTNEVQPDTRHPRYSNSYTTTGGVDYMSNWLMNYMRVNNDPRIRYYYYRQVSATPGAEIAPNEETLQCSLQDAPVHYVDTPFEDIFCFLPNGYWGRIHGNNEGIPPDGFLRTLTGVYPAGGAFDDSRFEGLGQGAGAGGIGITPLILASTVDFYRAEVAMLSSDFTGARNFVLSGLEKSVAKVTSFGMLDASADLSFAPSTAAITNHANAIAAKFDAADLTGKWNVLAEEFFTNLYGNGIDGYNFYRRTGYPTTVAPNIEPNPGAFIRSLFYPANFVNNNSNVQQKASVTQQVFWDNNPPSPGFPIAN